MPDLRFKISDFEALSPKSLDAIYNFQEVDLISTQILLKHKTKMGSTKKNVIELLLILSTSLLLIESANGRQLESRGVRADHLMIRIDDCAKHDEGAWALRLPSALVFLFGKDGR